MDERLNDVKARHVLQKRQTCTRKFNLVTDGIPVLEEEDNAPNVVTLGKRRQINLIPGDIDVIMHRMNTKSKDKPRPIIAKFSNYNAKSKLYKATLNLRNTDLKDAGAEKIFINGEPSFSKRREK